MSDLIIPNEAKINWAQAQIDDVPTLSDCYLRLFKAPVSIARETTLAELEAVQADFTGYAPQVLTDWSDAVMVDTDAMTEAEVVSFEATEDEGGYVYGCYATNGAGDKLWFASEFTERVPTPFFAELKVAIQLNLTSIFSP